MINGRESASMARQEAIRGDHGVERGMKVLIIGGGVMGSSVAYWLSRLAGGDVEVTVIERDPTYARASSALSASSIRQQFSTPVNIALSQYGIEFLRHVEAHLGCGGEAPMVALKEAGYLLLASGAGASTLRRNVAVQKSCGVDVALLEPAELAARFPWMRTEGLVLASLGLSGEGWFDGWALLSGFRRCARRQGARFLEAEVVALERRGQRLEAARLSTGERFVADWFMNAAGPWAARIAAMAGIELPVEARRRSVFVFACPERIEPCPLVVDPSGVWFRPEGRGFITGAPPPDAEDLPDLPLEPDHALFEESIWPALAERVPAFERLRITASWAGYYAWNRFDRNALVGPHPELENLLLVNGFSGHGMQQAPGIGRGLAEWLLEGAYRSLDLSPLSPRRLVEGRPLEERNVI